MRKDSHVHEEVETEEEFEEILSVAIYSAFDGDSVLFEDCTQPLAHLKIEERSYPIFCDCGFTYLVPELGNSMCVCCKRDNTAQLQALLDHEEQQMKAELPCEELLHN